MMSESYDSITYILWLYWKLRCLEGSPQDFQKLFEDVASRARNRFIRVRPYGNIGDRKCDGLYWDNGTVYQVYSPDEMKEAETRAKIENDLSGALAHWGKELKRWVFVYNVRRGLAPDVLSLLQVQREKYKDVTIEPMSNDDLWKIVRGLPLQERIEILGPPSGYEEILPLVSNLPEEVMERFENGRFVLIQDILSPIYLRDAVKAMEPVKPFAPPLFIRPPITEKTWVPAADYQRALIEDILARCRERLPRFAVFSFAPIPLAIHLGFLLSDRVELEPFQYNRDLKTWQWEDSISFGEVKFMVQGIPKSVLSEPLEIAIRVSLSAEVLVEETVPIVGKLPIEVDLTVENPNVMWLVSTHQIVELGRTFRGILGELRRLAPKCTRLHLFYAGPTGGAIIVGQAINPRMNPQVAIYEYNRGRDPRYEHVLTLE